jgi:ribosomal protein S18 acetylase RimI-like enzyme
VTSTVEIVEGCAFDAWPAAEVVDLGGWRLRFTQGVTRRGNSTWPGGAPISDREAEARIDRVEERYAARELPSVFQLTPLAMPVALDRLLEKRGYVLDAPTSVHVARAEDLARPSRDDVRVTVSATLTEAWFDISARRGRFAAVTGIYEGLLARIGGRARYALAQIRGTPCAVGLGVMHQGWLGIFSMLTLPELRGHGAGRAVLSALARGALEEGAEQLYLQVEQSNEPALALYRSASFRELYAYHYRARK